LTQDDIRQRFPAFNAEVYVDGFFNLNEGYAESGRAVAAILQQAERDGVTLNAGQDVVEIMVENDHAIGVRTRTGDVFRADSIVLAAGAWSPYLYPPLLPFFRITGQPIYHLKPPDPTLFDTPYFSVFGADIANTGWYGFPLHLRDKVVKIGYHTLANVLHPTDDERVVTNEEIAALREFLRESLPSLADAEIVYQRCCLYCNTLDQDFLISRVPNVAGLTIATGGSGHGFKFGPVLGGLIADAVEDQQNPYVTKFGWRW
jgi:glycine/D-amino acid oxidase-like deaminating enzyme